MSSYSLFYMEYTRYITEQQSYEMLWTEPSAGECRGVQWTPKLGVRMVVYIRDEMKDRITPVYLATKNLYCPYGIHLG